MLPVFIFINRVTAVAVLSDTSFIVTQAYGTMKEACVPQT